MVKENDRENRKGNIQMDNPENWQHWVHKTKDEDKQNTTMRKLTHK